MQMYEYELEAIKTKQPNADLFYILGKIPVEGGEAFQHLLKAHYHGKTLDTAAIIDELGDVLWYVANAASMLDVPLEVLAQQNIDKLRRRHGETYNPAHYGPGKTRTAAELAGLVDK